MRAFKAVLFTRRLCLPRRVGPSFASGERARYILDHQTDSVAFRTTFADGAFHTHFADLDFNFRLSPICTSRLASMWTRRAAPSWKRRAAMCDWFERPV